MKRSKGFTLVELLVVVGIIALLVTILMPTLTRARELAKQAVCQANLNGIGKGLHIYMAEYDRLPLIAVYGDPQAGLSSSTMTNDLWEVDNNGNPTLGTNAMQNVWPIIKGGTSEKFFKCPSDGDWAERDVTGTLDKYGWVDNKNFSYGLHKPYDDAEADTTPNKAPLTTTRQGSFVIMADKGNGKSVYWTSNSDYNKPLNHNKDGFACLTFQASVKFWKTSVDTREANSKAGIASDDVYVCGDEDGDKSPIKDAQTGADDPADDTDGFIVPWEMN